MADQYTSRAAARKAAMAAALMQGATSAPQGGMVGRYYVGDGIGGGIAKIGQALLARKLTTDADTEEQAAIDKAKQDKADAFQAFSQAVSPKPVTSMQAQPGGNGSVLSPDFSFATPKTSAVAPDNRAIASALMQYQSKTGAEVPAAVVKLLAGGKTDQTKYQFGPATVVTRDGKNLVSVPIYDPSSGDVRLNFSDLGAVPESSAKADKTLQEQIRAHDLEHKDRQAAIGAKTPMLSDVSSTLTGEDLLKTLDPGVANVVKGLAEGRMPYPTGAALRSPQTQRMLQLVAQYDPSFDALNYQARAKTRADFTSGGSANNLTALKTAVGHLVELKKAYASLGNSDVPFYNKLSNAAGVAAGNTTVQKNKAAVDAAAEAVAHELASVFRRSGMSLAEVEGWQKQINSDLGPAQQDAVIRQALDLMMGRLIPLAERYNQGMGTAKEPLELLSDDQQNMWRQLTGEEIQPQPTGSAPSTPAPAAQPGKPSAPPTPKGWSYLGVKK